MNTDITVEIRNFRRQVHTNSVSFNIFYKKSYINDISKQKMIIYKKSKFYYASMYLEREKTGLTFNKQNVPPKWTRPRQNKKFGPSC